MSDLEHILGELLPQKRQWIDSEAVNDNMGSLSRANDGNSIPNITGVVPAPALGQVGRKNQTPCMPYGGMNPFTVPTVMLRVEVNSMFQQEKNGFRNYLKSHDRWCFFT